MAELTDERMAEALRFRANKEKTLTQADDEALLEQWAEFGMVIAENLQNPNLQATVRDISNQIILDKGTLSKGDQEGGASLDQQGLPPELAGQAPLPPGGGFPPGLPQGVPQGVPLPPL